MALDTSLALRLNPIQIEPQANALAKLLQTQGQMQQNALGGLQIQQTRQQMTQQQEAAQRAAAEREFLANNDVNTPEGLSGLMKLNPQAAFAMQKTQREAKKAEVETKLAETKGAAEAFKLAHEREVAMLNLISSAKDQASYTAAIEQGRRMGLNPEAPPQFDPQFVAQAGARALSRVQQLEQEWKAKGHQLQVDQFGEVKANNLRVDNRIRSEGAANRGVQVRGQNMTDTRARETADIQRTAGRSQVVETPEGFFIVDKGTGLARPASTMNGAALTPRDKPLTDAQSKALLFGSRMQAADKVLGTLADAGTDTSIPGSRAPIIGGAINAASSAPRQQLDQAKRDFINATLRRESGAVISPSEFDNAEKQYFPQIGDSAAVKSQKANNRAIAIRGVQAEIPAASRGMVGDVIGNGAPNKPSAGGAQKVANDSDYNALPSGSLFVGPDGKTRRKP